MSRASRALPLSLESYQELYPQVLPVDSQCLLDPICVGIALCLNSILISPNSSKTSSSQKILVNTLLFTINHTILSSKSFCRVSISCHNQELGHHQKAQKSLEIFQSRRDFFKFLQAITFDTFTLANSNFLHIFYTGNTTVKKY